MYRVFLWIILMFWMVANDCGQEYLLTVAQHGEAQTSATCDLMRYYSLNFKLNSTAMFKT